MTPVFVSRKYPLLASAVSVVEPSATVTACHSTNGKNVPEPPNDTAVPLIVIDELANLAFVNEPEIS